MDQPTRRLTDPAPDPISRPGPTPQTGRCRVCGAAARPFEAMTLTYQGWMALQLRNPDGPRGGFLGLGEPPSSFCEAWVCLTCGYTEFYTRNPAELARE